MAEPRHSDDHLCWLAVRKEVDRRSRPSIMMRLFGALSADEVNGRKGTGEAFRESLDLGSDKKHLYAFAVSDIGAELNPAEREILRQTGRVPEWFMAAVQKRYAELKS